MIKVADGKRRTLVSYLVKRRTMFANENEGGAMLLDESQQTTLIQISWIWERSHEISVIDGVWRAVPRDDDDPDAVLVADDAWGLRLLLRADSAERSRQERRTT
jgi:hypothetical protein